ncbi:MAG TPA: hypothetical protein VEL75_22005 [Candidatus Methylomirabilis sp.]|nr:hypothetical protein [Candidatus Methylomirabilis sp.]
MRQWQIAGTAGLSSFPLDDSWIHMHFARNLAEGHGFSYNPGVPVAGSTAPLWTLMLAAIFAMLGQHVFWAKVAGITAQLATALLARRLAWAWTGNRWLALLAGLLTATAGPLVWGALSGMEVALAALLATGALVCHAAGRDTAAALLLGLATLSRPESLLLAVLVWLAGPMTPRRTGIFAGLIALCVGPWILFNWATAGTPLPATAAAKIEGGLIGFLFGSREPVMKALVERPWQFAVEWVRWLWSVNGLFPPLLLVGWWALGRRRGRSAALPAAALVLQPMAMALLAPYRGPGFQEGRYSIHLLPLAIAVAVSGLTVFARLPRLRAALVLLLAAGAVVAAGPAADRYGWGVQNIDAMQVRLGRWVAANTPPDARLALNDVGAIAYFSRREVVDMIGLVTPAIIRYRRDGEAGVLRYLELTCPDYLIVFPEWFPQISAMRDRFTPIYRVRLDHNTVAGADEMVVYETPWRRSAAARGASACAPGVPGGPGTSPAGNRRIPRDPQV